MSYSEFIRRKRLEPRKAGFDVDLSSINDRLFDWQKAVVQWAVRTGRAALRVDQKLPEVLGRIELNSDRVDSQLRTKCRNPSVSTHWVEDRACWR